MTQDPVSPCSGVCLLDARFGWCAGCFRRPTEIRDWPTASAEQKQAILDRLDEREAEAQATDQGE
ncbi:MAG: hypothetical protein CMJ94_10420 [Planctomycetes bacterium]|nr:hypothetical protein [Planctomycetota bacterium]